MSNHCLQFMKDEFSDGVFPINLDDFIELIRLCVCEAKFSFEDEFFEQKFDLAMGNCLSPVCSNLYMEFFEKYLLRTILPDDVIWYRYVVFMAGRFRYFLCQLNNLVPSIEFSIEEEIYFKIPFLDVLIERVEHNFKFTIYRKPTNICSYIHYYSSHALSIKLATFSGMLLRALKICSDDYLLEEIEFIFSIGRKHKYPDFILDKAYNKALTTFNTDKAISPEKIIRNILVLPYHQCLQSLVHLFKINFNISLVFSYNSTIKKFVN